MVRVRELDRAPRTSARSTFRDRSSTSATRERTKLWATAAPTPSVDDSTSQEGLRGRRGGRAPSSRRSTTGQLGNVRCRLTARASRRSSVVDQHDTHESTLVVADAGKPGPYVCSRPPDYEGHSGNADGSAASGSRWSTRVVEAGIAIVDPRSGRTTKVLAPESAAQSRKISTGPAERLGFVGSRPESPAGGATRSPGRRRTTARRRSRSRLSRLEPPGSSPDARGQGGGHLEGSADGREIQGMLIHPIAQPAKPARSSSSSTEGRGPRHERLLTGYSAPVRSRPRRATTCSTPTTRSSTGRGVAFAKSWGQGDLANGEFTDIVDGIDALVREGLVDKTRVGDDGVVRRVSVGMGRHEVD